MYVYASAVLNMLDKPNDPSTDFLINLHHLTQHKKFYYTANWPGKKIIIWLATNYFVCSSYMKSVHILRAVFLICVEHFCQKNRAT